MCQTRNPCLLDGIPCHNGGSCIRLNNVDAKCACPAPYYGSTCEMKEYCSSTSCKNGGTCMSLQEHRDFRCLCPKGYAGVGLVKIVPRHALSRKKSINLLVHFIFTHLLHINC